MKEGHDEIRNNVRIQGFIVRPPRVAGADAAENGGDVAVPSQKSVLLYM
jgi:hypothetical protein